MVASFSGQLLARARIQFAVFDGLNANDFMHRTSVMSFTRTGLEQLAEDVTVLAEKEGLTAHAASVKMRLKS